jgi:hypothetical protein
MCKEMLVILVDRMVDKKRIMGKIKDQGEEAQGDADPKKAYSKSADDVVRQVAGFERDGRARVVGQDRRGDHQQEVNTYNTNIFFYILCKKKHQPQHQ